MDPKLDRRFPSTADIEKAALKKLPKFVGEYLRYGMGGGGSVRRNRDALDEIIFTPRYLIEDVEINIRTTLFGQPYDAPFGIAPVGMGGFAWPRSAEILAGSSNRHNIPFAASTFALASLEKLKKEAGVGGWFQLYRPNKASVEADILARAEDAGYEVLIVTVDVPSHMRRNHDIRNGFSVPPRMTTRTLYEMARHPSWTLAILAAGMPRFENLVKYIPGHLNGAAGLNFLTDLTVGHIAPKIIEDLRNQWKGKLILKGILDPGEAGLAESLGVDGIIVSNHGGRQLEAAPAPVQALPRIRQSVSDGFTLIADGGIRTGLDICRTLSKGADFVMMGRPFYYAIAAMGAKGADHVISLLKTELECVLGQMGCCSIPHLKQTYGCEDD